MHMHAATSTRQVHMMHPKLLATCTQTPRHNVWPRRTCTTHRRWGMSLGPRTRTSLTLSGMRGMQLVARRQHHRHLLRRRGGRRDCRGHRDHSRLRIHHRGCIPGRRRHVTRTRMQTVSPLRLRRSPGHEPSCSVAGCLSVTVVDSPPRSGHLLPETQAALALYSGLLSPSTRMHLGEG